MALENTFNLTDQQFGFDVEAAEKQAALDVNNALIDGAEVDFSTAEDPFGDLGGLNVDYIKNTPENNTGQSITNQGGGPGDPVPTIKPAKTMQDLINISNKQKASLKNFTESLAPKLAKYQDPMLAYGAYTFDQYATNVDRYRGYNKSTFNSLGFNPFEDNEQLYNANTTGFQDFKRMTGQWGSLFGTAFLSSYNALANSFVGNGGLYDPDEEAAEEYEKAMRLGMSSKETVMGKATNFTLNLAYTAGIGANILAEEFALAGIVAATGGGASGAAGARTATNLASIPGRLNRFRTMMTLARQGLAHTSIGAGGQILKGGFQTLKSLKDIGNARIFYTGVKTGLTTLGKGTINLVNPLRGTTRTLAGIAEGTGAYRNLSNYAKLSKGFGAFYRDMRENLFAIGESQLEGGMVYNQVLDEQLKYYRETHNGEMPDQAAWATIYNNSQTAGELDALVNIPLIFLSNRFVFDGIFKFRALDNALDAADEAATSGLRREITRDVGSLTFRETVQGFAGKAKGIIGSPKVYLGNFLKYTRANFAEGIQENLQETTGAAISNYYINVYKNPVLGGHDYAKSMVWQGAKDNIFSPQGLEIFLNGFLMGGAMKGITNSFTFAGNQINNLYNSKFNKEKYQEYLNNKKTLKARAIDALNGIMSNPEYYFNRRRESMVNQVNANQNMSQAEINNDDKTFYDSKDEKTFDHIFTALDNNTFDLVINALQDMSNLSESEIANAFNMSDGTKAKDKIAEYIKRANEIKNIYGQVNREYSNPFNPKKYKKTDAKFINEVLAYKAYEDAKKLVIASQFGFGRSVDRLKNLFADLASNPPILSASATDFTVLQNSNLLNAEIELLADEVKQLNEGGPKQKELAAKKKQKLDALIKYSNALETYLSSAKPQTNVGDKGQFDVPLNEELQAPLKEAYKEYLKAIANISDDKFVFDNKIDNSFKKVLDIYSLDQDAQNYLQNLNGLLNPEMFARHAALINENLSKIWQDRQKLLSDSFEEYFSINELNNLTKNLAEYGVKLTEDELKAMVFAGETPAVFLDMLSGEPLADTDPRVQKAKDAIETYLKLREDKITQREADEKAKAEVVKPKEEEKPKEEVKPVVKAKGIPEDLKGRLQQAYDEYIDNNPDAVITFEEYVDTSAKAAGIKAQYEAEQKKTKPEVPTTEQKYNYPEDRIPVKREDYKLTDEDGNVVYYRVTTYLDGSAGNWLAKLEEGENFGDTKVKFKTVQDFLDVLGKDYKIEKVQEEGYEKVMNPKMFERLTEDQKARVTASQPKAKPELPTVPEKPTVEQQKESIAKAVKEAGYDVTPEQLDRIYDSVVEGNGVIEAGKVREILQSGYSGATAAAEYINELGIKAGEVAPEGKAEVPAAPVEVLRDVESTTKALEGVDEAKLPKIQTIPTLDELLKNGNVIKKDGNTTITVKEIKEGPINKLLLEGSDGSMIIVLLDSNGNIPERILEQFDFLRYVNQENSVKTPQSISEAYHKAKADGSNPELVKAVEDLLAGEVVTEAKPEVPAAAPVSDVTPVYHHTNVKPQDFNFGSFQRGKAQVSQFGDGLNASSTTTPFLTQRYGDPIQGEVKDSDFIVIDANKSEKELYEELKSKGYKFNNPARGSYIGNDSAKEYNGVEKANEQPAIISLFNDFQKSNPQVKGVKVVNHIIGDQKVDPFYVIYDAKSFYGPGSLSKKSTQVSVSDKKADIERRRPTAYIEISKDRKNSLETFRNEAKREWDGVSIITGDRMKNLYVGIQLFVEAYPEYKELLDKFIKKENGDIGITNNNLSFVLNTLKKQGVTTESELGAKINAKYDAELDALEGTKPVSNKKDDIERRRQEALTYNENYDSTQDIGKAVPGYTYKKDRFGNKTNYKGWASDGTTLSFITANDEYEYVQKVNAKYDAELDALEEAKPAEVVTEKPIEKKPKPITIKNGKITIKPTPTDTFSQTYTFTVKDGKIVEGRRQTYFQGEYRDRATDDPISNPAEQYDKLSAVYTEQQITQDSSDVIQETSGTDKAKSILDSVSSIKELPNSKLTDANTATAKLLDLVAQGQISSKDVLALVEQRRNELLEKMNPTDLSKNDYVTFTDGRKGWVTSTNAKKNTVNVKMVGSPKGVVETIGAEDLRKNLSSVEKKKVVKVEPAEEVAVSKADKETITESRDTMDEFKNDAAKAKQIADEIAKSDKTDNTDNLNDLLDSLGCDV